MKAPTNLKECLKNFKTLNNKYQRRKAQPEDLHVEVMDILTWIESNRIKTPEQREECKLKPEECSSFIWKVISLACKTWSNYRWFK